VSDRTRHLAARDADHYGYVIVGGGSAGCAVASRLTEIANVRVLLIEAGPDMLPHEIPAATLDTFPSNYDEPSYRWTEMLGHNLDATRSPARPLHQARVIGGGSTIMGMMALRGIAEDYEEWRSLGAVGWGWQDVLPFFRKLEKDVDCPGPLHGSDGPVIIRRAPLSGWSRIALEARAYAEERGRRWIPDFNSDFADGFGAIRALLARTAASPVRSAISPPRSGREKT
jgi:5-(hydroxymethyl)furfural/furfural oxidase